MRLTTAQRIALQAWARGECNAIADEVALRIADAIETLTPEEGARVLAMGWRGAGEHLGILPLGSGGD